MQKIRLYIGLSFGIIALIFIVNSSEISCKLLSTVDDQNGGKKFTNISIELSTVAQEDSNHDNDNIKTNTHLIGDHRFWQRAGFESKQTCGKRPIFKENLSVDLKDKESRLNSTENVILSNLQKNNDQKSDRLASKRNHAPKLSKRVAGGDHAILGQFPSIGSLLRNGKPMCAANLVGPNMIITAGHCVRSHLIETDTINSTLEVVFGSVQEPWLSYSNRYKIGDICVHWKYCMTHREQQSNQSIITIKQKQATANEIKNMSLPSANSSNFTPNGSSRFDLAIMWTEEVVKYSDVVQPVCMPTQQRKSISKDGADKFVSELANDKDIFEAAGFGRHNNIAGPNPKLTFIQKSRNCTDERRLNVFREGLNTTRCYLAQKPGKSCKGDSGSGLFYLRKESDIIGTNNEINANINDETRQFMAGILSTTNNNCDSLIRYQDNYLDFEYVLDDIYILASLRNKCDLFNERIRHSIPICSVRDTFLASVNAKS